MTAPRWIEYMALDDIRGADVNPKLHDAEGIARSMDEFGVVDVITMDERTQQLVSGHGRLESFIAAREDPARTPPEGVVVDDDGTWRAPVVRGWASRDDDHAAAAIVAMNHLTERGGWDDDKLADMLTSLQPSTLSATGYGPTGLSELLQSLGRQAPNFAPTEETQPRLDQLNPVRCPECGHEFHP